MALSPDPWTPLKDTRVTPDGRWESKVRFNPSSEWFFRHFEESPLLPGAALLALAVETVKRQGQSQGRILEFSAFSRVRFKRVVLPDEELRISVAGMPPDYLARLDFQVVGNGETVAQGELDICEEGAHKGRSDETTPARTKEEDRARAPARRCEPGRTGR